MYMCCQASLGPRLSPHKQLRKISKSRTAIRCQSISNACGSSGLKWNVYFIVYFGRVTNVL